MFPKKDDASNISRRISRRNIDVSETQKMDFEHGEIFVDVVDALNAYRPAHSQNINYPFNYGEPIQMLQSREPVTMDELLHLNTNTPPNFPSNFQADMPNSVDATNGSKAYPHTQSNSFANNLPNPSSDIMDIHLDTDEFVCSESNIPGYNKPSNSPLLTRVKEVQPSQRDPYPVPNLDQVPVQNELPSATKPSLTRNQTDPHNLPDSFQKFLKFVPLFNSITGKNFASLLVKVLRECLDEISLDDFCNLLFNVGSKTEFNSSVDMTKIVRPLACETPRTQALELCHLVLETFRLPTFTGGSPTARSIQNSLLLLLSFEEIFRTFLSLKIIFGIIHVNEDTLYEDRLPRLSVYNAYYIIWHKIYQKYAKISTQQRGTVLTLSQLGKLTKLVFPTLTTKRLGKRGESKYHYTGVKFNDSLIDDDIKRLVCLDLSDLGKIFSSKESKTLRKTESSNLKISSSRSSGLSLKSKSDLPVLSLVLTTQKALYSFVDSSMVHLTSSCFLREWEIIPGKMPQQSQWSKEVMQNSVDSLKGYNIDISHLSLELHQAEFSIEAVNRFLESILLIVHLLLEVSSSEEAYLHLYLIVSLLFCPVALASDKEISFDFRKKLLSSLIQFVTRLETGFSRSSLINRNNLMSFVNIIRKIIRCNHVLLSRVPTSLVKDVVTIISGKARLLRQPEDTLSMDGAREIIYFACVMACNAFNWDFAEKSLQSNLNYRAKVSHEITDVYLKFVIDLLKNVSKIPLNMTDDDFDQPTYELAYQISKELGRLFHEVFLSEVLALKLPIKFIELIVVNITNAFQNVHFHRFGKLGYDLSKETYKTWWTYSTGAQEYMSIHAEVVALSLRVA